MGSHHYLTAVKEGGVIVCFVNTYLKDTAVDCCLFETPAFPEFTFFSPSFSLSLFGCRYLHHQTSYHIVSTEGRHPYLLLSVSERRNEREKQKEKEKKGGGRRGEEGDEKEKERRGKEEEERKKRGGEGREIYCISCNIMYKPHPFLVRLYLHKVTNHPHPPPPPPPPPPPHTHTHTHTHTPHCNVPGCLELL